MGDFYTFRTRAGKSCEKSRLVSSVGFIKPLILIVIISSILTVWVIFGPFYSFQLPSFADARSGKDIRLADLNGSVNPNLNSDGIEILEQAGLRASANIDWSMLYGSTESERNKVSAAILEASSLYGVNADLLRAIIMTESVFNDKAVSKKGSRGLMQLMPGTAVALRVSNLHDPRENILGGAAYFSGLVEEFNGDIRLSLAAYNAGPRAIRNSNRQIPADILPYVNRVMSYYSFFAG